MKSLKIPCDCVGGKKYCGSIKVNDFGDNDCEILLVKYGRLLPLHAVYLNQESIKKLVKYLEKYVK